MANAAQCDTYLSLRDRGRVPSPTSYCVCGVGTLRVHMHYSYSDPKLTKKDLSCSPLRISWLFLVLVQILFLLLSHSPGSIQFFQILPWYNESPQKGETFLKQDRSGIR